jgi:DNA polymerase-3 subunit epsilon
MKKTISILVNVFLIIITGGGWLLLLVPFLIWTKRKNRANTPPSLVPTSSTKSKQFQGSKFAQDGANGAIFSYASLTSGNELDTPFSLIDVETTGLDHKSHRIIEIAIRKINPDGSLIEEFSTLINPEKSDVGPTFIHHIKAEDVLSAPTFKEIAPLLLEKLSGSIVVAHHAAFEDSFISSELRRIGMGIPPIPCLDTLWLSRRVLDLPNYKLSTVTSVFGIDDSDAHTALGDVRMISQVLPMLLNKSQKLRYKAQPLNFGKTDTNTQLKTRVSNLSKGESGWMKNVMKKLPESSFGILDNVSFEYLDQLSKSLSDSKITGDEAKVLAKLAGSAGLGATQVKMLHQEFFASIEAIALADGVIDDLEKRRLEKIKNELGL